MWFDALDVFEKRKEIRAVQAFQKGKVVFDRDDKTFYRG